MAAPSESRTFYVYEHWRPDTNVCFYVGKGHKRRAYLVTRLRNRFHAAVVRKLHALGLSVEVRIVKRGMTEQEALAYEMDLIADWRRKGVELTNAGAGGTGNAGRPAYNRKPVVCLETREMFHSAEHAASAMGFSGAAICDVCRESYRSVGGKHFIYSDVIPSEAEAFALIRDIEIRLANRRRKGGRIVAYRGVIDGKDAKGRSASGPAKLSRPVLCLDDGSRYPSASAAARAYHVNRSSVIEMCLGRSNRKSVGGFRFCYEEAA